MVRLFLIFSKIILVSLFVGSCYIYNPIKISHVVVIHRNGKMDNISSEKLSVKKYIEKNGLADKTYKDRDVTVDTKGNNLNRELKESHKREYRFFLKKYFAISCLFSELGKINNRGVEYALKGRFKEAEILFKEVLTEEKNFAAAFNNLGIIYELFGHFDAAFNMYTRACLLEPGNRYFRRNFLYFKKIEK